MDLSTLSKTVEALERANRLLAQENDELRRESRTDSLTGLGNRRFLEERTHGRGGYFVAVDLNGFKRAQDRHVLQHKFGDLVLQSFARLLLTVAAEGDRVACRVGGDEFIVWCPTRAAAHRIQASVHEWALGEVTASAGVGRDLQCADSDCRRIKQKRKGLLARIGL